MNKRQAKKRKQIALGYFLHMLVETANGRDPYEGVPGWIMFYDGSSKRRSLVDWDEMRKKYGLEFME